MATALTMMTRAMRLARVIGKGEALDDDEAQDGFEALNAMLDSMQTERLYVYQIQEDTFTWTATQSRTVGATGNFVMSLPARIDPSSYFRINGVDTPVDWLTQDQWAAITSKSVTSTVPSSLYVEYGTSTHTLYVFPVPSSSIEFHLRSWQLLQSFSALTDVLALPMGYERMITFSLAEEFCSEFGKDVPPRVSQIASTSRRNIKRINTPVHIMATEVGYLNRAGAGFNIYSG